MSRPSLAATTIRLALAIYIACRDVMPLWRDHHWLAFDFKVARSSVGLAYSHLAVCKMLCLCTTNWGVHNQLLAKQDIEHES